MFSYKVSSALPGEGHLLVLFFLLSQHYDYYGLDLLMADVLAATIDSVLGNSPL